MTTVPILLGFNGSNYQITRSLRFRSSATAYLNRTPSVNSNPTTFTFSAWIKRGALGTSQAVFSDAATSFTTGLRFTAADQILFEIGNQSSASYQLTTSAVFRDPSAWYHIVAKISTSDATASNRVLIYVNGVLQTTTGTQPTQNFGTCFTTVYPWRMGDNSATTHAYLDGYLAEIYYIDGQALTPSSFGYFDLYGVWQPKKYNGTFGTNGFYLPFSNTTSTTTLVADSSGNGNNWTPNNISLTAGTTYDSMIDSPTNYADGGMGRGNYAVLNPTQPSGGTYQAGNQQFLANTAGQWKTAVGTMFATSGKYYWEVTAVALPTAGYVWGGASSSAINLASSTYNGASAVPIGGDTNGWGVGVSGGNIVKYYNGSATTITAGTDSVGDVWMVAVDVDAAKIWFGRNGTWLGSGDPATGANAAFTNLSGSIGPACSAYLNTGATAGLNCGQRPFAYTPPSGFQALNTQNLSPSAVPYGAPYMNAITYTGYGPLVPSGLGILTKRNASTQNVSKSLRFRASASAYLNRTFGTPTNNKIWTYSFWTKRGLISNSTRLSVLGSNNTGNNSANFEFASETGTSWTNGDNFGFGEWTTNWQTRVTTLPVFRDPSAWYHIVIAYDSTQATASNRVKIYVNGSLQTVNSSSVYPTQNVASTMNVNAVSYAIGSAGTTTQPYDGYIAEAVFVDGQQLTPSSFGQTNSDGIWVPKAYTGTYGTNGFYLPFTNTTSTTTLGNDSSGNGNNFTVNNISLTAGTTYDSMIDSPTDYASAGNYAVINPLNGRGTSTVADGNLKDTCTGLQASRGSSITMTSGKWYVEATITGSGGGGGPNLVAGIGVVSPSASSYSPVASGVGYYSFNGNKYISGVSSSYGTSWNANGGTYTLGMALDIDGGTIQFYLNGVGQGAITLPSSSDGWVFVWDWESSAGSGNANWNFGQRPFTYSAPSGYSTLNTYNITAPSKTWFSSANNSGNASATAYPDFVWIKARSSAQNHSLNDTLRGPTLNLVSNSTAVEAGASTMFAVNKYGLTLGNDASVNSASATDVMWGWQGGNGVTSTNTNGTITSTVSASTTSGVSIVTYTGNEVQGATVGHGLGVAPSMIIIKSRSTAQNWPVYHVSTGNTGATLLNLTNAFTVAAGNWNNTTPSSTVITLGGGAQSDRFNTNKNGDNYVAYCFAAIRGFSAFGSYTGNGSTDGPFVYTGFKPRWIIMKCSTTAGLDWNIVDTSRNLYNVTTSRLWADLSNAEDSTDNVCDILSNGFKLRSTNTNTNASGATFIYAAFAENPFNMSRAR